MVKPIDLLPQFRHYINIYYIVVHLNKGGQLTMNLLWIFAAVGAIYGAIAGSFFENTPLTAVAFGVLAIVFALAAYRDISGKR